MDIKVNTNVNLSPEYILTDVKSEKKEEKISKKKIDKNSFDYSLAVNILEDISEELDEVLEKIGQIGQDLIESPSIEKAAVYKKYVSHYLKQTKNGLEIKELSGRIHKDGSYNESLRIIKLIDEKLNNMYKEFLNQQAYALNLTAIIDEIRGLLVDVKL